MTEPAREIVHRAFRAKLANAESRTVDVVASTDAEDSYGDIVEQTWRLERYLANPVVLYAHNARELPIGFASDVAVVDGELRATLHFVSAAANPVAEQVWQGFKEGSLRGVSVGFYPNELRWEMRDGRDVMVLGDNELLEISVVPVPANPEAVARMRARALGKSPAAPAADHEEENMDKELLKMLGLPETATAEQVRAAVAALKSADAERASLLEALGQKSAAEAVPVIRAGTLAREQVEKLATENTDLRGKLEAHERSSEVEAAIRRGFSPAYRDPKSDQGMLVATMTPAQLKSFFALTRPDADPAAVTQKGTTGTGENPDAVQLTELDREVCKRSGQDPEKFLAQKREQAKAARG